MKNSNYRTSIIEDDYQAVVLYKENEEISSYESCAVFELKGNNSEIILHEVSNDKLITVNEKALVQIFDIASRTMIFQHDFKGETDSYASISNEQEGLYICYYDDNEDSMQLEIIDLERFTIREQYDLGGYFYQRRFSVKKDGNPQFYYVDEDEETGTFTHGIRIFDRKIETFKEHEFEKAVRTIYLNFSFFALPDSGIGFVPYWEDLDVNTPITDNQTLPISIKMIDLESLKELKVIKLVDFPVGAIEDVDEFIDTYTSKKLDVFEYNELMSDFYNQLRTPFIDKETNILWFEIESNYYIGLDLKGNIKEVVVLKELSRRELRRLPFLPKNRELEMEFREEEDEALKDFGKVVIRVDDLNEDNSVLNALDQLLIMANDIDTIRSGFSIVLNFEDKLGQTMNEEAFFNKAVTIIGGAEKVNKLYLKILTTEDFEMYRHNAEVKALGYALYALVMYDECYLETVKAYYRKIDMEHDIFTNGTLLPDISKKYPNAKIVQELNNFVGDYYEG